jgi:serine/threonine protein kinase
LNLAAFGFQSRGIVHKGRSPAEFPIHLAKQLDDARLGALAAAESRPQDRVGGISISEALEIAIQGGRGLEGAHAKDVVHRDIKPANLMLTSTPSGDHLVRILDFGIAQSLRDSAGTQDELTMGTVCYMPPEQIRLGGRAWRAVIMWLCVVF